MNEVLELWKVEVIEIGVYGFNSELATWHL